MLSSPWPRRLAAMGELQSRGSWLSPSAEPSGPLTATARRAAVSGQAEFSVFHAVAERIPQICCEDQHRTLLIFRVTDGHDTWQAGGHFHAVAAVVAAQRCLAPPDAGQVHFSSATFMIMSRERRCVRLSDRRVSKVKVTWATTSTPSTICPPAAVSRYTIAGASSNSGITNAP